MRTTSTAPKSLQSSFGAFRSTGSNSSSNHLNLSNLAFEFLASELKERNELNLRAIAYLLKCLTFNAQIIVQQIFRFHAFIPESLRIILIN
ncbi:MAG: hypothetical protein MHMPM18_002572 [Marteilia pararefringens]